MTRHPVATAPRPLLALFSDAVLELLDPSRPPERTAPSATGGGRGYAAFEAPTYQRRGIRIAGLDDALVAATAPSAAPVATRASAGA
jgi:hypothetical protein